MIIREMKPEDYDQIYSMWQITSKRALSEADSRQGIEKYLARNPGMSMVAEIDGKIVIDDEMKKRMEDHLDKNGI